MKMNAANTTPHIRPYARNVAVVPVTQNIEQIRNYWIKYLNLKTEMMNVSLYLHKNK